MGQSSEKTGKILRDLVLIVLIISSTILGGQSKPVHPEIDPVDICIFTCDFCYQAEALMRCANECVALDGIMRPMWKRDCPYFDQQPIFSSHKQLLK